MLMKNLIVSSASLLLLGLASASIACDYPDRADIPNGSTATRDERRDEPSMLCHAVAIIAAIAASGDTRADQSRVMQTARAADTNGAAKLVPE